ncbi:MAG TPA: acyl-CoA dehydrogenase [Chitinophagaceae bacterium]|nr:acyl-CoA dehydrogenase [Chitinophagaceae bacterium]
MQYLSFQNLNFLLYDVHHIHDLLTYPKYSHIGGREEMELLLQTAKDIADKEMFPFFKEMDEHPVVYKDGKIRSHPQLKNVFKAVADAGWFTAQVKLEEGGMQLPYSIFSVAHMIFEAANSSAQGYLGLTTGALELIELFAAEEYKKIFMPPMMEGKWQGTMALTEPQAGSSLSDITATAKKVGDHYEVRGQKIFISGGEHEACENFVHLTLARIEGAPAGTKGISLFIIPKYMPAADGALTDNHVICAADFSKMGQRGYATTHLIFGESGTTKGYLVGEPNKGLQYMFQLMNSARIAVGQTAAAVSSAAYYYSLNYANERPQGRHIGDKDLSKEQTLIINHADVRRMLLLQKAFVEGAISLVVECLKWYDLEKLQVGDEKERAHVILELLTPIVKTYPSEYGIISTSNALQVFGGYGFTMDFNAQQYFRDIRIMSIYEGTTGIQSMDLLGRKVQMKQGQAIHYLMEEMMKTADTAASFPALKNYEMKFRDSINRMGQVLSHLQQFAAQGNIELYMSDANLFMELAGITAVAWQWLKQGIVAQQKPVNGNNDFYHSKMETLKFYYKYELPKTLALADSLMNSDVVTIKGDREVLM